MRVNFTLEATGSFTFGYDIQSYVKILLCIQIIECFALETSSWSVCQEQGKTGGAFPQHGLRKGEPLPGRRQEGIQDLGGEKPGRKLLQAGYG